MYLPDFIKNTWNIFKNRRIKITTDLDDNIPLLDNSNESMISLGELLDNQSSMINIDYNSSNKDFIDMALSDIEFGNLSSNKENIPPLDFNPSLDSLTKLNNADWYSSMRDWIENIKFEYLEPWDPNIDLAEPILQSMLDDKSSLHSIWEITNQEHLNILNNKNSILDNTESVRSSPFYNSSLDVSALLPHTWIVWLFKKIFIFITMRLITGFFLTFIAPWLGVLWFFDLPLLATVLRLSTLGITLDTTHLEDPRQSYYKYKPLPPNPYTSKESREMSRLLHQLDNNNILTDLPPDATIYNNIECRCLMLQRCGLTSDEIRDYGFLNANLNSIQKRILFLLERGHSWQQIMDSNSYLAKHFIDKERYSKEEFLFNNNNITSEQDLYLTLRQRGFSDTMIEEQGLLNRPLNAIQSRTIQLAYQGYRPDQILWTNSYIGKRNKFNLIPIVDENIIEHKQINYRSNSGDWLEMRDPTFKDKILRGIRKICSKLK